MPKVKISEYSATANSNTDVASINIDEGCAPSGINNAIRAVMGHLKDFQQGTNGDSFNGPVNGTVGATTPSTGAFTTLSATGNVTLGDASTDTLNVGNGGLIKDASGNLGVGVTPSAWSGAKAFDIGSRGSLVDWTSTQQTDIWSNGYFNGSSSIYKTTANASIYRQLNGQHIWYTAASGTAGNAISFTQAMTLTAAGDLGIGTSSPSSRLHVKGTDVKLLLETSSGATSYIQQLSASPYDVSFFNQNAGSLIFGTNNTGVGRFDASGNLLVGTTSAGDGKVRISANANAFNILKLDDTGSTGGNFVQFLNSAGSQAGSINHNGTTSVNYGSGSDYRLKDITGPVKNAADFINSLKPKVGTWKADGSKFVGFLAHEFAEVCPQAVVGEKDGVDADGKPIYQSMEASSSEVIANMVSLLQEQQTLITQLTARITALEGA